MLFALTLGGQDLLNLGLAFVAALAGSAWFVKKDTGIEERRRTAIDVAAQLQNLGLGRLAEPIRMYSVGDYSGLFTWIKSLSQLLKDPSGVRELLNEMVFTALPVLIQDDATRERIKKAIGVDGSSGTT